VFDFIQHQLFLSFSNIFESSVLSSVLSSDEFSFISSISSHALCHEFVFRFPLRMIKGVLSSAS
jgi:hypothetical protein